MYFNIRKWYKSVKHDTGITEIITWPKGLHGKKVVSGGIDDLGYFILDEWCSARKPKPLKEDSKYGRWI